MNAETLKSLQDADDPVNWEFPDGWLHRYPQAVERVKAVAADLESALGLPVRLEDRIQDASFFAGLLVSDPHSENGQRCVLCIRFSAFGSLFTVYPQEGFLISESQLSAIRETGQEHGFVFSDPEAVAEPYSGAHPGFRETTWGTRFFDYI